MLFRSLEARAENIELSSEVTERVRKWCGRFRRAGGSEWWAEDGFLIRTRGTPTQAFIAELANRPSLEAGEESHSERNCEQSRLRELLKQSERTKQYRHTPSRSRTNAALLDSSSILDTKTQRNGAPYSQTRNPQTPCNAHHQLPPPLPARAKRTSPVR